MRRCETCGNDFEPKAPKSSAGRFCSRTCYYAFKGPRRPRKERINEQRMTRAKGHPIAPPGGMVAVARLVLYDKIGPGPHPCAWCSGEVDWKFGLAPGALIADHRNWDRNDDSPENLVPACNPCNVNRQRAFEERALRPDELTVLWSGVPTRAVARECQRCGDTFLIPPSATTRGRGKFCSRDCQYGRPRQAS